MPSCIVVAAATEAPVPMIDFNNLREDYFDNKEDAFNFTSALDMEHEYRHVVTIRIVLEEEYVKDFI